MLFARDNDKSTLSGKVLLKQETSKDIQAGTLMYAPVFRKNMPVSTVLERRSAIIGWVYCPYRMDNLLYGILGRYDLENEFRIHLQIFDDSISSNSLLFSSQNSTLHFQDDSYTRTFEMPLDFNGKKWILHYSQPIYNTHIFQGEILIILIAGLSISILMFCLVLILSTITDRAKKLADLLTIKLKESETRFRSMADTSPLAIYMSEGLDQKALYINPTFTNLFGYVLDEIPSAEQWWPLAYPDENYRKQISVEWKTKIEYAITHHSEIEPMETNVTCKDGSIKNILWGFSAVGNQNWAYGLNLTDQKIAEEIVKKQNNDLTKLNADKDRFISILAHDLKGPFNNIIGFLDLIMEGLRETPLDETENRLKIVNQSAARVYNLLEDLLTWTRAQSGNSPFNPEELDLESICSDVINNLELTAKNKNISLEYLPTEKTLIFADKNSINTVIRNLVSNALKYTNKGGLIQIKAEIQKSDIRISVSDNGIGIDPERARKLFDFASIQSTPGTEKEKGTGLGLLLCKEFIEKHKGKIWLESTLGKGSEFIFTLPR